MIHLATRGTVSFIHRILILSLCFAANMAVAATVGDQVELNATHQAGVPFHSAPGGSQTFQRVPDGTVATVTGHSPAKAAGSSSA